MLSIVTFPVVSSAARAGPTARATTATVISMRMNPLRSSIVVVLLVPALFSSTMPARGRTEQSDLGPTRWGRLTHAEGVHQSFRTTIARVSSRILSSMGLGRYAAAPAARQRASVSRSSRPAMMMTGTRMSDSVNRR